MCGQQVLYYVKVFGVVEIGWLVGQDVEFVCCYGLFKVFVMFVSCRSFGNVLQFNDFCIFIYFFCDVIVSYFFILYVVRGDMVYNIVFCCLMVESDDWDFCLVCYFYGVVDGIRVGGVDQQQFGVVYC